MIIDFCTEIDQERSHLIEPLLSEIELGGDRLKDNYKKIQWSQFLSFTGVLDAQQSSVIAFSGLQKNVQRWGEGTARILSRYYIKKTERNRLTIFGGDNLLGFQMFEYQLSVAKAQGLDSVFISRDTHWKSFKRFIDLLNERFQVEFQLSPEKKNICGPVSQDPSCFQYVAYLSLNPTVASRDLEKQ